MVPHAQSCEAKASVALHCRFIGVRVAWCEHNLFVFVKMMVPSSGNFDKVNASPADGQPAQNIGRGRIHNSSSMVRRNFSNPLPMIRPWRRKHSDCDKSGRKEDHARKVSIDHTVLSAGDDGPLSASQDFSRSFDVDGCSPTQVSPPNFGFTSHGEPVEEAPISLARASHSEPSLVCHGPDENLSHRDQPPCQSANNFRTTGAPTQTHSLPPASQPSFDPALQARIEAIRIQQTLLGENHPDVIFALSSLAKLHQRRGNHAEAASILRESQMRSLQVNHFCKRNVEEEEPSLSVPAEISFPH